MIMVQNPKVVIVGGGFGGIKAALELAGNPAFEVTLISDEPNFRYYPALYRTAIGGKSRAAAIPLTEVFKGKGIRLVTDRIERLDRTKKRVHGNSGHHYAYDVLILALGVITNYYDIKGLAEHAFGIKTLEDAQALRDHLHRQLLKDHAPDLNYVVVGGGPTGVELAGELPAYLRHIMHRHGLPHRAVHVKLVEAEGRLTPRMPKSYSRVIARRLRRLGVQLLLNQAVKGETADELRLSGRRLDSHTVVWTAGVTNHPFFKANKFSLNDHGRVEVDQYLEAEPHIYVLGDNAATAYSGMAQTALRDGVFVAANLQAAAAGRQPRPYRPKKPVYVTPVGPGWAAVLWRHLEFYGRWGWLLRKAADFIAYHDYQPWWQAGQLMIAAAEHEESCPLCR